MNNHKQHIESFYTAFQQLDAEAMCKHYHPNAIFSDPAFGSLNRDQLCGMWSMLCENQKGKNFKLSFEVNESSEGFITAKWQAWYTFSKTGRKVHNQIQATFKFQDGLILEHHDVFNLHKWASQALGLSGMLLGWTPFFKRKLQGQTHGMLKRYPAKRSN